jgi:hypothetical protein
MSPKVKKTNYGKHISYADMKKELETKDDHNLLVTTAAGVEFLMQMRREQDNIVAMNSIDIGKTRNDRQDVRLDKHEERITNLEHSDIRQDMDGTTETTAPTSNLNAIMTLGTCLIKKIARKHGPMIAFILFLIALGLVSYAFAIGIIHI